MEICPHCKQAKPLSEFVPSRATNKYQQCRACMRSWYLQRKKAGHYGDRIHMREEVVRSCAWCETEFTTGRLLHIYCSRTCKNQARNAVLRQETLAAKPERWCRHCRTHMPKTMVATAAYCSAKCNTAAHAQTRKASRRSGAKQARIDRGYIIARDASRCHLCGKKCRPGEISLDHVIPLARGGTHTAENLRVAHLSCNARKRDRAANDQLMLVG